MVGELEGVAVWEVGNLGLRRLGVVDLGVADLVADPLAVAWLAGAARVEAEQVVDMPVVADQELADLGVDLLVVAYRAEADQEVADQEVADLGADLPVVAWLGPGLVLVLVLVLVQEVGMPVVADQELADLGVDLPVVAWLAEAVWVVADWAAAYQAEADQEVADLGADLPVVAWLGPGLELVLELELLGLGEVPPGGENQGVGDQAVASLEAALQVGASWAGEMWGVG